LPRLKSRVRIPSPAPIINNFLSFSIVGVKRGVKQTRWLLGAITQFLICNVLGDKSKRMNYLKVIRRIRMRMFAKFINYPISMLWISIPNIGNILFMIISFKR